MSLLRPNVDDRVKTSNRSRHVVGQSGLCSQCVDGCQGNCAVFQASFRGRELLSPRAGDEANPAGDKRYAVDYSHLNIQGYVQNAYPVASVQVQYGWNSQVTMAAPLVTGALGAADLGGGHWDHVAVGAAISGITIVCGENVCGADPDLRLDAQGRLSASPELDRRIHVYRRYRREQGEILLQRGLDGARFGMAEYVLDKHGLDAIELVWGQGVQCADVERRADSLARALQWQDRGHLVTPDPSDLRVQEAFHDGAIRHFERHARRGFLEQDVFLEECERLRRLGFQRITLHAKACGLGELATVLKWGSLAKIDLLTIDGASGDADLGPQRMKNEWGMPSLYLHSAAVQFADRLASKGHCVPHLVFAGRFSSEEHLFKAIALGSPYVKAVCLGRALMIPGMVGKNVGLWMQNGGLPKSVRQYGEKLEDIFVCWEQVAEIVGREEMRAIPLGAVGVYSYVQKLATGLQQLMAGAGTFSLSALRRTDLVSLTRECAELTGIPYVMDAARAEAEAILDG